MSYFDYPIESKTLLRKKLKIKNELLSRGGFIEKRIAVLGGSTTNEIVDQLELFLLNYGIRPVFYQSEYAQFWQDAVFGNEEFDAFNPDIVYIHTNRLFPIQRKILTDCLKIHSGILPLCGISLVKSLIAP